MEPRLKYPKVVPALMQAMSDVEARISDVGLERSLLELIRNRASQINGCAYCLDAHWKAAKTAGISDQRLYTLPAWRESPFYSDRERAALELCEAITLISDSHVPDEVFSLARPHFSDVELVTLAWAIAAINAWNRMAITFRAIPRPVPTASPTPAQPA